MGHVLQSWTFCSILIPENSSPLTCVVVPALRMEFPDTQPDFEDPFWDMVGSPEPKRAKAREALWFCSTVKYMFVGLQSDSLRISFYWCHFSSFVATFKTTTCWHFWSGSQMGQ